MTALEFNHKVVGLKPFLENFAKRFTSDVDEAKDLLQETLLKAFTYREKFAEKTNLKAWLFTIMRNTFINQYRRNQRVSIINDKTDSDFYINSSTHPKATSAMSQLNEKEIVGAINELEADLNQPFTMYVSGFKYKEISDKLEIPIGTVKSRIFLARKKLMRSLSAYDPKKN